MSLSYHELKPVDLVNYPSLATARNVRSAKKLGKLPRYMSLTERPAQLDTVVAGDITVTIRTRSDASESKKTKSEG